MNEMSTSASKIGDQLQVWEVKMCEFKLNSFQGVNDQIKKSLSEHYEIYWAELRGIWLKQ